jgi:ATP-binding cassette subfamily F protein 2
MSTQVSASKAKRLAAKAARDAKSGKSSTKSSAKSTPIPSGNNSTEDLGMGNLNLKVDRTATGVYSSQERSRDIKIESYSLNYFGRVLIENATIELNFGRRYGLVGSNGSGKSTFLHSIAEKDIEIPDHIDVSDSNYDDDDEREGRG